SVGGSNRPAIGLPFRIRLGGSLSPWSPQPRASARNICPARSARHWCVYDATPSRRDEARMLDDLLKQIDPFVETVREHWQIPGVALAIVRRAGPIFVRTYGLKNHAQGTLAGNDTAFAIGSCSKAFTATLARS